MDVSVAQPDDDARDMVIDFKDLKRIANEVVCARFDHAFIYSTASTGEREIAAVDSCAANFIAGMEAALRLQHDRVKIYGTSPPPC